MWEILFWVAFSAAAVFGLICALWLLADWLCGSRIGVAVRILDHEARENMDLLLSEAKDLVGRRRDIIVLLSEEQPPLTTEEIALLQRYGVHVYIV